MLKLRKTEGYLQHVLVACQDKRFASQDEGHIGHLGDLGAVDEILDKKKKHKYQRYMFVSFCFCFFFVFFSMLLIFVCFKQRLLEHYRWIVIGE